MQFMQFFCLDDTICRFLAEDIGAGDMTTTCCVAADKVVTGQFIAKANGVICGTEIMQRVFALLDPRISVTLHVCDGNSVMISDSIAEISGPAHSILAGERVALNLLQHLSGIATQTAQMVSQITGTKAKVCDTRKTTPGLRALEKYAVKTGGGHNHRFGLSDGILIKDNHIAAVGTITKAILAARTHAPHTLRIEVEVETLAGVAEAVAAGADIIMLDNMDTETMEKAVQQIAGRAITEASGNMDRRPLRQIAETGIDYISIGALTHSVSALDISLKLR